MSQPETRGALHRQNKAGTHRHDGDHWNGADTNGGHLLNRRTPAVPIADERKRSCERTRSLSELYGKAAHELEVP